MKQIVWIKQIHEQIVWIKLIIKRNFKFQCITQGFVYISAYLSFKDPEHNGIDNLLAYLD